MRSENVSIIQQATAKAYEAQVRRTLSAMRVRGWAFPAECAMSVRIIDASALRFSVEARVDDVTRTDVVSVRASAEDIAKSVERLVAAWLTKHGRHGQCP